MFLAHEGHIHSEAWLKWMGWVHLSLLHFPIAFIVGACVSEFLFHKTKKPFFDNTTRFLLFALVISVIPTVVSGFFYSYTMSYNGYLADFLWWHRFIGFFIAAVSVLSLIFKELNFRKKIKRVYHNWCLAILFISVCITGYLGGQMSFS